MLSSMKANHWSIANTHYFHSGAEKLKDLENMTFIGNSRMIINQETRGIQVETRISRVIPATGLE